MNLPNLKSVRTWFHARSYATVSPVRDWGLLLGSTTLLFFGCVTLGIYTYFETTTIAQINAGIQTDARMIENEENLSEIIELLQSRRARVEEFERAGTATTALVDKKESLEMEEVSETSSSSSSVPASSTPQDMFVE